MPKISYQFFTKRNFSNYLIFLLIILFISKSETVLAKDIKIKKYCDFSKTKLHKNKMFLTKSDNNFNNILKQLKKSENLGNYNIIVLSNNTPTPGYNMDILKIKQTKKKLVIYFDVEKKNASNLTAITYPYCLIRVENFDKFKIKVKKRRLKFLPVGLF